MTLIIPSKQLVKDTTVKNCFRETERAFRAKWNPIQLYAGWSAYGTGFQVPQYQITPDSFVHLRGLLQYTGSITNGTLQQVATLYISTNSTSLVPPLMEILLCWLAAGAVTYPGRIQLQGISGVGGPTYMYLLNQTGVTLTNPLVSLSGLLFSTVP